MAETRIAKDVFELASALGPRDRLLGLDVGEKTVGLAIADPGMMIASPLKTLERRKFADVVAQLKEIVAAENVGALVVGLPVSMDGTLGPKAKSVSDFTVELTSRMDIPAAFWDERLSTSAVERFLISEADMTRKRRKEVVDKMAAAYILQGAIDAIGIRRRNDPA